MRADSKLKCNAAWVNGIPFHTTHLASYIGSMPFSVELDITGTDESARQPWVSQAAAGWRADTCALTSENKRLQ